MEQWSILSNNSGLKEENTIEVDFGSSPDVLREEYLDVYGGIHSEVVNTTTFDENSDLSTTYLRRSDRSKNDKFKAEESFPISEHGYATGKLLDGAECQLLLDTGTSKSFMSKPFYMHYKSLHTLPKFSSKTQRIQVGNGQFVSVLFIIPVIIDLHRYRFELYNLVSEINKNLDLVLGIKNIFKLGVFNSRDCWFKFLNRSLPIFPKEHVIIKPKEQTLIRVTAPFIDEISGSAIIKILNVSTYSTMLMKLKFTCNSAMLDIVNKCTETIIFKPEEMIEIVDLRLIGYYKIKPGILTQNLSKYYRFERAETLCMYFNKFINILKKDREQVEQKDSYPWLDSHDDRKYMTDQEILDKYIDFEGS